MIFKPAFLEGAYTITLEPFIDERGWFARIFDKNDFEEIGHYKDWVQINHSVTVKKGTIRGMHFQLQPFSEVKLVRCVAGAVFDVIIDLREGSETYLQWFGAKLSAENKTMMYIPEGFAHGFQSTEDGAELIYHHTAFYTPAAEAGIRYDDPSIRIHWPLPVQLLSTRDEAYPLIDENFKGL